MGSLTQLMLKQQGVGEMGNFRVPLAGEARLAAHTNSHLLTFTIRSGYHTMSMNSLEPVTCALIETSCLQASTSATTEVCC